MKAIWTAWSPHSLEEALRNPECPGCCCGVQVANAINPLVFLGNISMEFFLIHWLVIRYLASMLNSNSTPMATMLLLFIISFACAWGLSVLNRKLFSAVNHCVPFFVSSPFLSRPFLVLSREQAQQMSTHLPFWLVGSFPNPFTFPRSISRLKGGFCCTLSLTT